MILWLSYSVKEAVLFIDLPWLKRKNVITVDLIGNIETSNHASERKLDV